MQIYLAKPGGLREGPYTLDQINRDLASRKYSNADYWAWHEGLAAWMPLHSLPGLSAAARAMADKKETAVTEAKPEPPDSEIKSEPVAPEANTELPAPATSAAPSISSGRPFSALEQIFVLTTGDGPSVFKSEVTTVILQESAGEALGNIQSKVPVDVIGRADAGALEAIRGGSIPDSAWRALSAIKPAIVQQAQEGVYHLCIRTSPVGAGEMVALLLLYNKQKP